ncbi:hypothetical protein [uncultured Gammaproteobacteria bacterium]|nr:hypothetical protein [uncultured Gammaproteobacteria bacterium]
MCWTTNTLTTRQRKVSVAGCLGYDVLGRFSVRRIRQIRFQLLVV